MAGTVFFRTLGCKVNQTESSDMAYALMKRGIDLAENDADARITIINTCSVTAKSDAKVRKAIRKALGCPSTEFVFATGCSAVIQGETLARIDERVIVEPDKEQVVWRVAGLLDEVLPETDQDQDDRASCGLSDVEQNTDASSGLEEVKLPVNLTRTRVNLKISDGCENFCSYCIVPFARGPVKPMSAESLLLRTRDLVEQGVKEIVLTGINIGTYRDGDTDIAKLIRILRDEAGIHRIRISSIEPQTITQRFTELLRDSDIVCEHLHIPLQSGSDSVLRDMNRNYTADEYRAIIADLRAASPDIAVHADVIVGYPTETDEDFERTVVLAKDLEFAGMHLFRYSARPGTASENLTPLDPAIVEKRFTRLQEIADRNAKAYREKRLQSTRLLELVIEQIEGGRVTATSREHITISWEVGDTSFPEVRIGDIVEYTEGSAYECLDSNAS